MRARNAFSLVELLVVLALIGILALSGYRAIRPVGAERSARDYLRSVQSARIAALAGTPTSVRWNAERQGFEVRFGATGCSGELQRVAAPLPRVAVTRRLRDGVAWLPDGSGRSCGGGGVYGGRVRFEDRGAAWEVVVASTGRLRIEVAP
jgi:prepilin-type N-terminal cleavage/methylation domain-containing protein